MPIRFRCSHCQGLLSISRKRIGALVTCPTCGDEVLVPDVDAQDLLPRGAKLALAPDPPPAPDPGRLVEAPPISRPKAPPKVDSAQVGELELLYPDGRREQVGLTRTSPLSIGSQSFNDICIPGDEVASLHCRIGWAKSAFEVTAATKQGVDVNGSMVQHAVLKSGDVLRVGAVDLIVSGVETPSAPASADPENLSLFEGDVLAQSMAEMLVDEDSAGLSEEPAASSYRSDGEDDYEAVPSRRSGSKPPAAGMAQTIAREMQGGRARPGEQDIFRSPLILGLGLGSLVVLLIGGTIWFLMYRQSQDQLYELAMNEIGEGKFSQGLERLEEFRRLYPHHAKARESEINLGKARIQKELSGSAPAWVKGWERLQEFQKAERDAANYKAEIQPLIREFAEQLAFGTAKAAEAQRDESLHKLSIDATKLFEQQVDPEVAATGIVDRMKLAAGRAETAIIRQRALDATLVAMDAAMQKSQPIEALRARDQLLMTYQQYRKDPTLQKKLQAAIESEQKTVRPEEIDRPARSEPLPPAPLHAIPLFHARSRTDESSIGQTVFVVAQDSCLAVDTMTGEPVWRTTIGERSPFFPIVTRDAPPRLLLHDGRLRELRMHQATDGRVLWRTALDERPRGAPLLQGGHLYQVTQGGTLERYDLGTGRLTGRLRFSQELVGPPVVAPDEAHLLVAGEHGVLYALSINPLECAAVTFTNHAAGAVPAPLVTLGKLLLLCDNDQSETSRLRLWDATKPDAPLTELNTDPSQHVRIKGHVLESPVARGSQLVVPSQGERLAAFVVNDEPGRAGLARVGDYRVTDRYDGPASVRIGPDNQFWMSSTALRRFEIAADTLKMDPNAVAMGLNTQPMQVIGEMLFVGRRAPFAEGVNFTNVERERMAGSWRTIVGSRPVVATVTGSQGLVLGTESGVVLTLGANRLTQGGFELRGATEIEMSTSLTDPLVVGAVPDQRLTVSCGGEKPQLWVVDREGRAASPIALPQPLQQPPLWLDNGWLLPLSGRLHFQAPGMMKRYEDWQAPIGTEPSPWMALLPAGGLECVAATQDGRLRRIELRAGENPHIAEVSTVQLPNLAPLSPARWPDRAVFADLTGTIHVVSIPTLDREGEHAAGGLLRGLWPVETRLLTQTQAGGSSLIELAPKIQVAWTTEAPFPAIVGQPLLHGERLWCATRQGDVIAIDPATGKIVDRVLLPQNLALGPWLVGNALWVAAVDATVYRVTTPVVAESVP